MNEVEQWAVLISKEISPDEIDSAPDIVNAYLAGGKKRRDLFIRSGETGNSSFGGVDMVFLLPTIFDTISHIWAQAQPILSNAIWIKEVISFIADVLDIRDFTEKRKKEKIEKMPSQQPFTAVKVLISAIDQQLKPLPLKQEQRDLTTFRILKVILENSGSTNKFISHVRKNK